MLSFALIFLLQNPETYLKAQSEVDRVVGSNSITLQHIRDLKYIYAVLQETLRLVPTAPMIGKIPHPQSRESITTLDGKYQIDPDVRVRLLLAKCMQDPKVFGEDAKEFNPERMLENNPDYKRQESYWRPFSEGMRSCLGRAFSLQEGMLALTLILQNFDLRLADPMYKTRIRHTITVKPLDLYIKASLRNGMTPLDLESKLHTGDSDIAKKESRAFSNGHAESTQEGVPLKVLFGTNTGTCQALAQRLASEASTIGFNPEVLDMDAAAGRLSQDPTIIITSSYEGEPPDNALYVYRPVVPFHAPLLFGRSDNFYCRPDLAPCSPKLPSY